VTQTRDKWWADVSTVMNLGVPQKAGNLRPSAKKPNAVP
jgi:hypothetical protein